MSSHHKSNKLRILHCLRSPVGGLFRHVRDLVFEQARLGYDVGIICDSTTGGRMTDDTLSQMRPICKLGITRIPMARQPSFKDFQTIRKVRKIAQDAGVNILHGHGSKGGAYARLVSGKMRRLGQRLAVFYTPHGGSLHYANNSFVGKLFLAAENRLAHMTDGLIFESAFAAEIFEKKVGSPPCPFRIIPNGLHGNEFHNRDLDPHAADFLFIGELRKLKGVDVLLDALAQVKVQTPVSAVIVGSGPDEEAFKKQAKKLGIAEHITFTGAMPASEAFPKGRCLIVPSRAESFPYIILEAAAAEVPIIATNVGGIPEMVNGTSKALIPPGDVGKLLEQMENFLTDSVPFEIEAELFAEHVADKFTVEHMTDAITDFYFSAV